ncbi:MAG: DNA polymerase I [Candidatus Auribacter fodinae]|uniref:DNA polymerase I n=1 Tax=Candidatus Auribacter fodinae TaxID=2093366 RepID=A0A3A4R763_9BACT|nr:MAG: DNA polymerase I [Candidatus Auribacter fodinae]
MKKKIYLIDGTALAYRSYFAFIRAPLINSKGDNTSAVFGFANTLRALLQQDKPEYILVAFDISAKTFRHDKYPDYKATREKMPDDMRAQLPLINDMLRAFKIQSLGMEGVEADDIIGSAAKQFAHQGYEILIVTADKDFMQLVDDDIRLYDIKSIAGESRFIDSDEVVEKFGVKPENVTDVLGLMGDSSDNIPGVPSVGPKTAYKLLAEFFSLENIYNHIAEVQPEKLQQKLLEFKDQAFLSKDLATIDTSLELPVKIDDLAYNGPDNKQLVSFFQEMEFTRFLKDYELEDAIRQPVEYHCIKTWSEFLHFFELLKKQTLFAFDTETTSVNPVDAQLVGMSFSFKECEAYYIPAVLDDASPEQGDLFVEPQPSIFNRILNALKPLLENADIHKCGHNIKYDTLVMMNYGITVRGVLFDTMIASYLLRPTARQHNLDSVSLFYLNFKKIPTSSLIGTGKNQISMAEVPVDDVARYACEDADITLRLHKILKNQLEDAGLMELFTTIEMPLVSVLQDMEATGVAIDTEFFKNMSGELGVLLDQYQKKIYELAGEEFNINSPQQLGIILFDKLEIHKQLAYKVKKTKIGYRTDVEVLEALSDHPLPCAVLEYRQLAKLKSTYVDTLPALVSPRTHRVHTSFNQTVTATGRLSSSDPNLQNIPVRTELGRQIRKGFIASDKSKVLLAADYSQIELRILAHLSGDAKLIEAFQSNEDIHTKTASLIFGLPMGDVSKELRGRAKAINFGIIYGMGQQKLARDTGISNQEAKSFIANYFATYTGVRNFIDTTIELARKQGYVTTLFNRRREIPEIHSENNGVRANAEHIAVNTPIQGTCADLIKIAMIDIFQSLQNNKLQTKLLLQIHDELVFEVPECELETVSPLIRQSMETAISLSVPIVVEIAHGNNWMEI